MSWTVYIRRLLDCISTIKPSVTENKTKHCFFLFFLFFFFPLQNLIVQKIGHICPYLKDDWNDRPRRWLPVSCILLKCKLYYDTNQVWSKSCGSCRASPRPDQAHCNHGNYKTKYQGSYRRDSLSQMGSQGSVIVYRR